jgi:lipid-binding SYLF domain-containing protein
MKLRLIAIALISASLLYGEARHVKRLNMAAQVFTEIMEAVDSAIPQDLLDHAACIVILPGAKKGAFIIGAKYGRGYLSCRKDSGVGWTGPGAVRMEGFNFGLQFGGSETDIIMLVMNERGVRRLLRSKFTIGGDVAGVAGPVGRTVSAQTDVLLTAEILSYSRSRGIFAGVSLEGATLRQDTSVNRKLYGQAYSNKDIINMNMAPPAEAERLVSLLGKYSGRKGK